MNNIDLILNVKDNSDLFKNLNNITNALSSGQYKSIIYKKHSSLVNNCNKCWLNSCFQMFGYIDDIVFQIKNSVFAENPNNLIKLYIKKLIIDLVNGGRTINYGTSYNERENDGYGNIYKYIHTILMERNTVNMFEDSAEGLTKLIEYFFSPNGLNINDNNISYLEVITKKCHFGDYKSESKQKYQIYTLEVPNTIKSHDKLIELNEYLPSIISEKKEKIERENFLNGCHESATTATATTSANVVTKGPWTKFTNISTNKYFIIQLKLFDMDYEQNMTYKKPPNLKISKNIIINKCNYYLSGFIFHIGESVNGTHYTFYKILPDGSGILYDDAAISDIPQHEINNILTQNIRGRTPYILLYEKQEFIGNICKINYDMPKILNLDNLQQKLICYSDKILTNNIYEDFKFDNFVFLNNILYYKIKISDQNKENLDLFIDRVCLDLFSTSKQKYNKQIFAEIYIKILEFEKEQQQANILDKSNSVNNKSDINENIKNFKLTALEN